MRKHTKIVFFFIQFAFCFNLMPVYSQNESGEEADKIMSFLTPGPPQYRLKMFEGEWKQNWEFSPPDEPEKSYTKGISVNDMIFEYRYLQLDMEVEYLGRVMKLREYAGYDKRYEKYFLFRMESTNTYPQFLYGDYDEKNKQFIFSGIVDDPTKGKVPVKAVYKFFSEEKYTYEYFYTLNNKEIRLMFADCIRMKIKDTKE